MFADYKVAVRVSLVNQVSAGLSAMVRQFAGTEAAALKLQKRLDSIHATAKAGVLMLGAGGAMAAPFLYAIDKAAELQKQMIGIQSATKGSVGEMNNLRKSVEGIAAQTVFSNIDVAKIAKIIATGSTFNASQIAGVLPSYTRFADVQMMMKGTSFQESVPELMRLAHTAQKFTPEAISKYGDLLTKASFVIPGSLGEIGNALKYSQGIGKQVLGVNDESMILTTALLNQMGLKGSRGGTNLIAAMTRTIPGIFGSGLLKGKSNEALLAMGMTDTKGHSRVFDKSGKFDVFTWLGLLSEYTKREFSTHPEAVARQDIMKNMQHAFGSQGGRVASLLANPQALELLGKIGDRFASVGGVQEIQQKFADESVTQKWMNAKTNFVSALTELGWTLLPMATRALAKLNQNLGQLVEWMGKHQLAVKRIAEAFLGLSAALMFGGTVSLLTSGIKGLSLAFGLARAALMGSAAAGAVGTASGAGGLVAAIAALAGPIGIAVLAFGTLAAALYLFDKNNDGHDEFNHPGKKFVRHGRGAGNGEWVDDPNAPGQSHKGMHLVRHPHATSTWEVDTVKPGASGPGKMINNTIVMPDGRVLAQVVTKEQTREMNKPQSSSSSFDPTRTMLPVGLTR